MDILISLPEEQVKKLVHQLRIEGYLDDVPPEGQVEKELKDWIEDIVHNYIKDEKL